MTLISLNARAHFADGVLEHALRAEIGLRRILRPLVITDAGVIAAGVADRAIGALEDAGAPELFQAKSAAACEADAIAAAAAYAAAGCDGLVAVGGGSVIDLAKATGVLVAQGGPLARFAGDAAGSAARDGTREAARDASREASKDAAAPPLIAVPTTAGSGAELTARASLLLNDGRRLTLHGPHLKPLAAICDPTVTLSLSPGSTAASGMNAISLCVEAYLSPAFNPPADGVALDGLGRAAAHVARAVDRGDDRTARREMMASAMNAALASAKGLGSAHAAAVALSACAPPGTLSQGSLKAALLGPVLDFNAPAIGPRLAALDASLPCRDEGFVAFSKRIGGAIGLPDRLSALGVDDAMIEQAAPLAERERANFTNPRRVTAEDYRAILRAAL